MFGNILIYILNVTALGAIVFYFISEKMKNEKYAATGRVLYLVTALGIIFASAFLLSNILDHNFQYTYIWSYSSKELSNYFLVASFWAGQEGSFLLWALLLSIVGVFLLPYARKKGYEAHVMGIYSVIILFLLLILVAKSPFDYIWQSFANGGIEKGFMPENGRGLNPVLQNYWVTIHPPILFAGYAAMSVPYVFAVAGLWKKDYRNWVNIALPWNLFAAALLGLGIMLGGFWAYETLGWGGFWGWDPVENSSLLPWLVGVALIHTMLVQKRTGGLIKTNFFISIAAFVLVLYATFLTRSGILGDTSVHSFIDPGKVVYMLLMAFQVFFIVAGVVVYLVRIKDMPKIKVNFKETSKEFYIAIGTIVLLASALVVFIGTSFPLFSAVVSSGKSTVETAFYNNWNLPIIIVVLLINAISIYLNWRSGTSFAKVLKKSAISLAASVLSTILLIVFGVHEFKFIILGFSAFFSLFINLEYIIRHISTNPKGLGAYISHFGISLMMIGVLSSGGYTQTKSVRMKDNTTFHYAFGYNLRFIGREQIEKNFKDREKYVYKISAEKDGNTTIVNPVIYWSSFNQWQSAFFEPGIKSYAANDLYVSPKSVENEFMSDSLLMLKGGEPVSVPYHNGMKISLVGFDMASMQSSMSESGMEFGAIIKFINNSGQEVIDTLFTSINPNTNEFTPIWRHLPDNPVQIGFAGIIPNEDMSKTGAIIKFSKEVFTVDVSVKPFISLVWYGTAAVVLGFFISIFRHISNRKMVKSVEEKKEASEEINV